MLRKLLSRKRHVRRKFIFEKSRDRFAGMNEEKR